MRSRREEGQSESVVGQFAMSRERANVTQSPLVQSRRPTVDSLLSLSSEMTQIRLLEDSVRTRMLHVYSGSRVQFGPDQPLIDFLGPSPRTWNRAQGEQCELVRQGTGASACGPDREANRHRKREDEGREEIRKQVEARKRLRTHHRSVVTALGRFRLRLPVCLTCTLQAHESSDER